MAKFFISNLLLVLATCAYNTHAAGTEGGVATTIEKHPYIVSLQGVDGERSCAGVVINKNTVATAAQCLEFLDVSKLVVGVKNGAKVVRIASHHVHPDFDFATMENDVAVLKLAESVSAAAIQMAKKQPANGVNGVVTSWGANNNLVDISVSVLDAEECGSGKFKYSEDDILKTMLCGLDKNKKACGALPGSPLVVNNELVGLVSWGFGCANKDNPTVFADIPSLQSWVAEAAKKS